MYGSRREWFDHEAHLHRMQWICEACKQSFTSKGDFVKHVQRHHSDSFSEQQLPALLDMCSRPADDKVVGKCSFCFKEGQPLRRHMAHHMNALALFTLPGRDDNEGGDDESNKGEAGATESGISSDKGRDASSDLSTSDVMSEISQDAKKEIIQDGKIAEKGDPGLPRANEGTQDLTYRKPHDLLKHTGDFWDRAYNVSSLQEQWRPYENFLWQGLGNVSSAALASMSKSEKDELLSVLVLKKAEIVDDPRWQREAEISTENCDTIKAVLYVRDTSSWSPTEKPLPALAWAGVLMLLPTQIETLVDSAGNEDLFDDAGVKEALHYISALINRVTAIQDIYLKERIDFTLSSMDSGPQLKESFESSMIHFCAKILNCEAQAVSALLLQGIPADESPLPTLVADLKEEYAASRDVFRIVGDDRGKSALRSQEARMNELLRLQKLRWQKQTQSVPKSAQEETEFPTRHQQALNACLHALRTNSYESSKNRIPDRASGTCEWFLRHPVYHDWLEARSSNILWVTAVSGYGKSVLMKSLVDNELASTTSVATCYFFFKDDGAGGKDITNALLALLHQLCSQNRALLIKANEAFQLNGAKITRSFGWLWHLLTSLAHCSEAGKIICILDGLDECEQIRRKYIISAFNTLHADFEAAGSQLKFLLTSRRYSNIEDHLESKILRIFGDDERQAMQQDVSAEIKRRFSRIFASRALNRELGVALEARLLQVQAPTHLWLHLVFKAIMLVRGSWESTSELIEHLPENAGEAYETLLKLSAEPEQTIKVLQIVVAAERPLTLREMNMAMNIKEGQTSREEVHLRPEQDFAKHLDDLCQTIVRVYDGKIYLFHETAKEWWKSKITMMESTVGNPHHALAKICLTYISFNVFEDYPLTNDQVEDGRSVGEAWYNSRRTQIAEYAHDFDFLSYAATFWPLHYRSMDNDDDALITWWRKVCNPQSNRFCTWFRVYWYAHGRKNDLEGQPYKIPKFSKLSLASFLGHVSIVKSLIAQGEGSEIDRALIIAIDRKDTSIAICLIDHGASIAAEAVGDWTPLILAAARGLVDLAKVMIEKGANVDQQTHLRGMTALGLASANGHIDMVELMLRHGASTDITYNNGKTALILAIWNGQQRVAEVLIRAGADVRACDYNGQTALHNLNSGCDKSLVRLLLDQGADVDVKDQDGRTPLSWASQRGLQSVARILLQGGSQVDSRDDDDATPLLYALRFGKDDVVRELLMAGANANTSDNQGYTALAHALRLPSQAVTQQLLDAGADPNITDGSGQTPLMQALPQLHDLGVVHHIHCLVNSGADIDIVDGNGRTALSYAAEGNNRFVVQALLNVKANPNVTDHEGRTPLHYAAARSSDIVPILMSAIADVEVRDHQGKTPIDLARNERDAALMQRAIAAL